MLLKFLSIVLMGTLVIAEIPSFLKICGRRNPKFNDCIRNSVETIRPKLSTGVPELQVPSLEPLILEGLPLSDTNSLKAYAKNVKLYGFTNFTITDLDFDLEKQTLDIEATFKEILLEADYQVKARLIVPLQGHGPISIIANDITCKATLKFKLIKKKGIEYLFFPTMATKLNIKDYTATFNPVGGSDSEILKTAIRAAVSGGRQEIIQNITPSLEKSISELVLKLTNNIAKQFSRDELFPDRE